MHDDIQRKIDRIMNEKNNREIPEFEGYSPIEMNYILYDTFDERSPIKICQLKKTDYGHIPILNQILYLSRLIETQGEIKLTNRGYLPPKIVTDLYNQKYMTDEMIESGISKLFKESDSMTVTLTRILMDLSGIIKKRNNKISLTNKGKKLIPDNHKLLVKILTTFGFKFNWAYFDGYGENDIGQFGFGFTLILLSRYGNQNRKDDFYIEKYFTAFPQLLDDFPESQYRDKVSLTESCYSIRTFDRFLKYFGIIEIEKKGLVDSGKCIKKTKLFDKMITCTPHCKRS